MIVTVSSSAGLMSAIQSAHDGDTIQVAAGEYTLSKLSGLSFANGVTVTSADPTHQAVLDGVYLQNVTGLNFSNLEVKVDDKTTAGIYVSGGGHIGLSNLDIHGTGLGDGTGVTILRSSNVTVSNVNIHETNDGVVVGLSDTVKLTNNNIHNIQLDGIQVAGTSNIAISGNYFTDFHPIAGAHPDAIQFLTQGTTTAAHDISITNNTYVRGDAPAAVQGIFMGNEVSLAYQNVTITGNMIVGGTYHGISVDDANALTISQNTVEGYTDAQSWISVTRGDNVTETHNVSTNFNPGSGNTNLVASDNVTIAQAAVGSTAILNLPAGTSGSISAPAPSLVPVVVGVAVTANLASAVAPTSASATGADLQANPHMWSTTLVGGAGADTLEGGKGADTLTGGAGADHFVFANAPQGVSDITDFTSGQDVIDLRGMLSSVGYTGSNAIADHYVVLQSDGAGGTKLLIDTDGTGTTAAKYVIHLDHVDPGSLSISAAGLITGASASVSAATVSAPTVSAPTVTAPIVSAVLAASKAVAPVVVGVAVTANLASAVAPASASVTGADLQANPHMWSTNLVGGTGTDTLEGGKGADTLTGGAGTDHFVFANPMQGVSDITDFAHGQDVIDIHGMLASVGYTGSNAIADHYIVLQADGFGGTKLLLDTDGAGPAAARYVLHIDHVAPTTLTTGDFIFH